jgi:hypothetical protein
MAKTKPKPDENDALFLIVLRRDRAKEAIAEFLGGVTPHGFTLLKPLQILDYLTNMVMCLEMMLKVLADDWKTHNVGQMYQDVFGQPHPRQDLMRAMQYAVVDQKYLLSPASGLFGYVPELEALYDQLFAELQSRYDGYTVEKEYVLPANLLPYLQANVPRFYTPCSDTAPHEPDPKKTIEALQRSWDADLQRISETLKLYLSIQPKSTVRHHSGGYLIE